MALTKEEKNLRRAYREFSGEAWNSFDHLNAALRIIAYFSILPKSRSKIMAKLREMIAVIEDFIEEADDAYTKEMRD